MKIPRLPLVLILVAPFFSLTSFEIANAAPGTYSFTNAGFSGVNGPVQESVTAAYAGTTLAGQVRVNTRGIQEWTVPASDTYSVTVAGASGGYVPLKLGGRGRVITVERYFNAGQVLKILVGQEGGRVYFTTGYAGGGGGGSFVVDSSTSTALLVAGGGGGAAQSSNIYGNSGGGVGSDAASYNSTSGTAGTGGASGGSSGGGGLSNGSWCGGSGGGFSGDGPNSTFGIGYGGKSFLNGGVGGVNNGNSTTLNIPGGFGGGGGGLTWTSYETNAGGGGGYSGGGCGRNASASGGGGGGGNLVTGSYISNSLNTGNGYVTFIRMNLTAATLTLSAPTSLALRTVASISAISNAPGKVTFLINGKRIAGCINVNAIFNSPNYMATCNWKPSVRGSASISATITPTGDYVPGVAKSVSTSISARQGSR